MDLGLKNKVIIVTGGSKGIGEGIVSRLVEEGAIPVIIGRNQENILSVVSDYKQKGYKVGHAFAELTEPEQCELAVKSIINEYGRIDGLVNNAGVNDGVSLEHGTYSDFIKSIQRNLAHYYKMTQLVLPELKKNKGAIVNIGSKTATTGQGGTSGYAAANGGRNALTREWAVELLPYSIRVNCVVVAECFTPLYEKWINTFENPKEKLNSITDKIPLDKRMTTVGEIANTVVFLLSECSSHTTGQLIYVDGGYTHLDRALKISNNLTTTNTLKKYYLALDLKNDPEKIATYKQYHQNVWPEINQSLIDCGIHQAEIYHTGNRLFLILDVDESFSLERKSKLDAKNPKVREWESLMWKYQKELPHTDLGTKWVLMEKIYDLNTSKR